MDAQKRAIYSFFTKSAKHDDCELILQFSCRLTYACSIKNVWYGTARHCITCKSINFFFHSIRNKNKNENHFHSNAYVMQTFTTYFPTIFAEQLNVDALFAISRSFLHNFSDLYCSFSMANRPKLIGGEPITIEKAIVSQHLILRYSKKWWVTEPKMINSNL